MCLLCSCARRNEKPNLSQDLERDSLDALDQALHEVGLEVAQPLARDGDADLVISVEGQAVVSIEVKAVSIASPEQVRRLTDRSPTGFVTALVVRDHRGSPR